jgi:ATP-dependent Clp protease protease subunit
MSLYLDDLYDNRIVTITGEINEESCSEAIVKLAMLDLSGVEEQKPIVILINTQGGLTASAMGLANVIENSVCPVKTVCIGLASSAGSLILVAGKQRFSVPNAEIMIHQHWQEFQESITHAELMNYAKVSSESHGSIIDFYHKHSNLSKRKIRNLLLKDSYMTAETALKYGLIDGIGWNLTSWLNN